MKIIFKTILQYYFKYITKIVLLIHRPLIIGISGSINVTFTKDEIMNQLAEKHLEARSNPKNFNTEIGLPLAILNLPSGYGSYQNWLPIIWLAFKSIFNPKFPKILVLALGVSHPGDMKYLMSLIKPKIGIITDITQRYIESFDDMDGLTKEYELFVKSIDKNGYLILNSDNRSIKKLAAITDIKTIFFGMEKTEINSINYWRGELVEKTTTGQIIKVTGAGQETNYNIKLFGQHHIYALLSGLIVKDYFISH